jgi:hypothetical protein
LGLVHLSTANRTLTVETRTYIREKILPSINLETGSPCAELKEAVISHPIMTSTQNRSMALMLLM